MKLKAYNVYPGDGPYDEGCLLIFAETRNKAKLYGYKKGPWLGIVYIEMSAVRVKAFDKYAEGKEAYSVENNENLSEPFYVTEI